MKYRLNVLVVFMLLATISLSAFSNLSAANAAEVNSESQQAPPVKAFPGAAGFGTDTPGGRGGRVIYVTNLNDSGEGSLRAAIEADGPRVVLFSVSGTIILSDDIEINNPYLTVAGQTAPGEGVQIRGAQIKIRSHDIIIRYLKVRSGDQGSSNPDDRDAMTGNNGTDVFNIVIDHSTLIWGSDIGGVTFLNGAHDATVSNSIIGEGLYISRHYEATEDQGGHSMAMNITELNSSTPPARITVHHNLITNSSDRNPRIIGAELVDFVNNVVYNWRNSSSQGNPRSLNMINNYYIKGPMTTNPGAQSAWMPKTESGSSLRNGTVYESGNAIEGISVVRGEPQSAYAGALFEPYSMAGSDEAAGDAYNRIVADAGATRQVAGEDGSFITRRDSVDTRIINDLVNRTGQYYNGESFAGVAGFQAIAWPDLAGGAAAVDNDRDGMPDAWEARFFGDTSRGASDNSNSDSDGDGFTDLEEYLNGTDPNAW